MANNEVVDLTSRLVGIPSTADNQDACMEVLDAARRELSDFPSEEQYVFDSQDRPSLGVVIHNQSGLPDSFRVLLHGHLDVVPAQDLSQFQPTIEGDRLYGRGTYDMKAATAVLIKVFRELAGELPYSLGLSLTTDEETTGNNAKLQVANGVNGQFVLSGEPTDLEIGNQHKGLITLQLESHTSGGHTAYDGESSNALIQVMHAQMGALALYPAPTEAWQTSSSPVSSEVAGGANNVVPANATGRLSIRYVPQDDPEEIKTAIASVNPAVTVSQIGAGCNAHFTVPNNIDIRLLSSAIHDTTGDPARLRALPHSSDIIAWTNTGTAAIDFGPRGHGLHSDGEYVDIPSLVTYEDIITGYLRLIAESH